MLALLPDALKVCLMGPSECRVKPNLDDYVGRAVQAELLEGGGEADGAGKILRPVAGGIQGGQVNLLPMQRGKREPKPVAPTDTGLVSLIAEW